jgi:hypothetical protein
LGSPGVFRAGRDGNDVAVLIRARKGTITFVRGTPHASPAAQLDPGAATTMAY